MLAALLAVMGAAAGPSMGADYVVNESSTSPNGGHDLQSNDKLTVNADITYGGTENDAGAVYIPNGTTSVTVTVNDATVSSRYGIVAYGAGQKIYLNGATAIGGANDAIQEYGTNNYYRINGGTLSGHNGSVWSRGSNMTMEIVNGATLQASGTGDNNGNNINVEGENAVLTISGSVFTSKRRNLKLADGAANARITAKNTRFISETNNTNGKNVDVKGANAQLSFTNCTFTSTGADIFEISGNNDVFTMVGGSATITGTGNSLIYLGSFGEGSTIHLTQGAELHGENNSYGIYNTAPNVKFVIDGGSAIIAGSNGIYNEKQNVTVSVAGRSAITGNYGFNNTNAAENFTVSVSGASTITATDCGFYSTGANYKVTVVGGSTIIGPNYGFNITANANGGLIAIGKGCSVITDGATGINVEMTSSWNSVNVAGTIGGDVNHNHSLHVPLGDVAPKGNVFNLMDGAVIARSEYGLKNERNEAAYTAYMTFGYAPGANASANDWLAAAGTGIGDGALTKVDNNAVITVNDRIVGSTNDARINNWVAYVAAGTTSFNADSDIRETYIGAEGFASATLIAAADGPRTATRIVPVAGAKAKLIVGEGATFRAIDKLYIYTGGTLQIDGTLDAQNAFAVDGGALTVNGTATAQKALAVTDGTVTVAGTLGVTEALTLVNAQTTVAAGGTLNAPASLDATGGAITVDGALNAANELFLRGTTLTVNGTLTPPATLNLLNGATLRGTGTIVGDVTTAGQGGRIAPGGAAAGTLTFAGALTVAAGDALALRAGDGGTDKVAVNGALTLASGSQVTVTPNGGSQAGAVYTLATAGGGLDDQGASKTVDAQSVLVDYAFREDANSLMLAVSAKPGVYQEIAAEVGDKADAGFAAALDQLTVAHPPALDEVFAALNQMTDRREVAAAMRQLSAASGLGAATGALAAQRHNAAMGRYFGDTFARDVALRMVAGGGAFQPQGSRFGAIPGRQAPAVYERAGVIHGAPTATAAPSASAGALDVPMPADFDPGAAGSGPLAAPFGDAAPGAAARELPARKWQGDGAGDSRDGVRREPGKKGDKRAQAGGAPAALPDGPEPVEPAPEPRWNGFVVAAGSFGEQSHGGGVAGYSHKGVGALVGLERGFDANLTGGFQVGWARHVADIDDGLGEVDDDVVRFGAHARWQNERFFALSTPSAAVHMLESERNIAFLGRTAKGERTGFDLSWFNQAGVAVEAPHGFYLLPTASLALTWMHDPAYREGGAGAAELTLDAHDRWSLNSTLALRVGRPFQLAGLVVNPEIMGGWEHEYFEEGSVGCAFAAAPAVGWRVPVSAPARDRALLGASLTTLVRDRWEISARYEGRLWDGGHEHAFAVAVEFGF